MGGKRKPKQPEPKASRFTLLTVALLKAPTALAFVWPVLLVIGGYLAWHRWGANHINEKYNSLSVEQIALSPTPEYIRSDVLKTVFESTDLTRVSLLDINATAQIANAFATHPWIEQVLRIQKTSQGTVVVDVSYRRPIGMVKVVSKHPEVDGVSFFPIDQFATLLPTDDFAQADTHRYIHIVVKDSYPSGGVGVGYGDSRVRDLAALAAILQPYRDHLRIESVTLRETSEMDPQLTCTISMQGQRTVIWGSAPGKEVGQEPDARTKLDSLLRDPDLKSLKYEIAARPQ